MGKSLTPKKIDLKVKKLNKEITKLKALKEEVKKVDKLGTAVRRIGKKPAKSHHRRKRKK
jgi:hypothetical protein